MNPLQILKEISNNLTEGDHKLWTLKIKKQFYSEKLSSLKEAIDKKKLNLIDYDKKIAEYKEEVTSLKESIETVRILIQNYRQLMYNQAICNKIIEKDSISLSKRQNDVENSIVNDYENMRDKYEASSALFQEKKQLSLKLKMVNFNILSIENNEKALRRKEKLKAEVRQMILNKAIVEFARRYVLWQRYEILSAKLKEMQKEEREQIQKHIDLQESVKKQRFHNLIPNSNFNLKVFQIKEPTNPENSNSEGNKLSKLQMLLANKQKPLTPLTVKEVPNLSILKNKIHIIESKTFIPPPKPDRSAIKRKIEIAIQNLTGKSQRLNSSTTSNASDKPSQMSQNSVRKSSQNSENEIPKFLPPKPSVLKKQEFETEAPKTVRFDENNIVKVKSFNYKKTAPSLTSEYFMGNLPDNPDINSILNGECFDQSNFDNMDILEPGESNMQNANCFLFMKEKNGNSVSKFNFSSRGGNILF